MSNISISITGIPLYDVTESSYHGVNTTSILGNTTAPAGQPVRKWYEFIPQYAITVIFPLGFVLNFLSIIVIGTSTLRNKSTGVYLLALSVADSLVLLLELLTTLEQPFAYPYWDFVKLVDRNDVFCKAAFYLRYVCRFVSALIIIMVTAERLYLVRQPLRAVQVLKPRRAAIMITGIVAVSMVLSCFSLIHLAAIDHRNIDFMYCGVLREHYAVYLYSSIAINSFLMEGVNSIALIVMTILIIHGVRKASEDRKRLSGSALPGVATRKVSAEAQMTASLITVAVAFVVLKAPYSIVWTTRFTLTVWMKGKAPAGLLAGQRFCQIFYYLNYAINFFLLVLTGRAIRERFLQMFCCGEKGKKYEFSAHTNGTVVYRNGTTST